MNEMDCCLLWNLTENSGVSEKYNERKQDVLFLRPCSLSPVCLPVHDTLPTHTKKKNTSFNTKKFGKTFCWGDGVSRNTMIN